MKTQIAIAALLYSLASAVDLLEDDFLDNDDYPDNDDFLDNDDYPDNDDFLDNDDQLDDYDLFDADELSDEENSARSLSNTVSRDGFTYTYYSKKRKWEDA